MCRETVTVRPQTLERPSPACGGEGAGLALVRCSALTASLPPLSSFRKRERRGSEQKQLAVTATGRAGVQTRPDFHPTLLAHGHKSHFHWPNREHKTTWPRSQGACLQNTTQDAPGHPSPRRGIPAPAHKALRAHCTASTQKGHLVREQRQAPVPAASVSGWAHSSQPLLERAQGAVTQAPPLAAPPGSLGMMWQQPSRSAT